MDPATNKPAVCGRCGRTLKDRSSLRKHVTNTNPCPLVLADLGKAELLAWFDANFPAKTQARKQPVPAPTEQQPQEDQQQPVPAPTERQPQEDRQQPVPAHTEQQPQEDRQQPVPAHTEQQPQEDRQQPVPAPTEQQPQEDQQQPVHTEECQTQTEAVQTRDATTQTPHQPGNADDSVALDPNTQRFTITKLVSIERCVQKLLAAAPLFEAATEPKPAPPPMDDATAALHDLWTDMLGAFIKNNPDWLYRAAWDTLRDFKTRAPDRETTRLVLLLKVAAVMSPDEATVLYGDVPKKLPPGFPIVLGRMMTDALRELAQPYMRGMFFADELQAWEDRRLTLSFLMAQLLGLGNCDMTQAPAIMDDLDILAHDTEGVNEGWQDVLDCLLAARKEELARFAASWAAGKNPALVEYAASHLSRAEAAGRK